MREFWEEHPESKQSLIAWFEKISKLFASSFPELCHTFASADYVDGYTIFDIGGNKYRLIAAIHYDKQRVYVRHVLTHTQYDRNHWRKK